MVNFSKNGKRLAGDELERIGHSWTPLLNLLAEQLRIQGIGFRACGRECKPNEIFEKTRPCCQWVVENRVELQIPSLKDHARFGGAQHVGSYWGIPVRLDGEVVATLVAVDSKENSFGGSIQSILHEVQRILEFQLDSGQRPIQESEVFLNLTPKELEIARLIRDGMSAKEIAGALTLSPQTVHSHMAEIRRKLGLRNKKVNLGSYLRLKGDALVLAGRDD